MTYQPDYAAFVAARCKDGAAIKNSLADRQAHLLHMSVGIAGELGELAEALLNNDRANLKEEIGDYMFFIQGIANGIHLEYDFAGDSRGQTLTALDFLHLAKHTGDVVDLIKKFSIYQRPIDINRLTLCMDRAVEYLGKIASAHGITFEQAQRDNVEKLTARFHTGSYSDQQAQERADK